MIGPVRNTARQGSVSNGVAIFARRRLEELFGLVLLFVGLGLFIALATHDPADPSLNTAVKRVPKNLMGEPGAIVSDILVQSIGLAGILLALALTVWGWRLIRHRFAGRLWIKLLSLPLALLLTSIALAGLAKPEACLPAARTPKMAAPSAGPCFEGCTKIGRPNTSA